MATVARLRYRRVTRPLVVTFATALGSKDVLRSVIVSVTLSDGTTARGEIPTSHAARGETIETIPALLAELKPAIEGLEGEGYGRAILRLRHRYPLHPMTLAGIETALFRAFLFSGGGTEHAFWGRSGNVIETDITVPLAANEDAVVRWIGAALRKGFRCFKIKMGGRLEADRRLLALFREAAGDAWGSVRIRLDGNQGFDEKAFLSFCDVIGKEGWPVELFEQPLPKDDLRGFREIGDRTPYPIILDESVFSVEDLERALDAGAGDGVNIKVAKSGLAGAEAIYNLARRAGLKVMMGCMVETMVGLSAAIYFAAGKGGIDYVDLDAVHFLRHRHRYGDIAVEGPRYSLSSSPCGPSRPLPGP
jgi:L-alanine-DL-glutamate epimerase-like enolase superfamily enzyme